MRTIHRALKSGAWFATAVHNTRDNVPIISLAADTVRQIAGLKSPPPDAPEPTRLGDTSILESSLEAAGFSEMTIEPIMVTYEFASPDQFVEFRSELGHAHAMMAKRSAEQRGRVKAALAQAVRKFEGSDGRVRLLNETNCFSARA